jgi:hypothetical protein
MERNPRRTIIVDNDPTAIPVQVSNTGIDIAGEVFPAFVCDHVRIAAVVPFIPLVPLRIL